MHVYVCLYDFTIHNLWKPPRKPYISKHLYSPIFFEQVSSYPGQDVPIKLKAYDELNHTSAAVFQISLNESKVTE